MNIPTDTDRIDFVQNFHPEISCITSREPGSKETWRVVLIGKTFDGFTFRKAVDSAMVSIDTLPKWRIE